MKRWLSVYINVAVGFYIHHITVSSLPKRKTDVNCFCYPLQVIFEAIKRSLEKMNCDSDTAEHSCTQPSEEPIRHDSLDEADSTPSISEPNDEEIVRRYLISPVERCSLEEFIKTTPKRKSHYKFIDFIDIFPLLF